MHRDDVIRRDVGEVFHSGDKSFSCRESFSHNDLTFNGVALGSFGFQSSIALHKRNRFIVRLFRCTMLL